MKLVKPAVFSQFPNVRAAMSLLDETAPELFSMAFGIGNHKVNAQNRKEFSNHLGFGNAEIINPHQVHSDKIYVLKDKFTRQDADAIITNKTGRLVGVSVADCSPILLYDPTNQAIAAVHSGWRGTKANILAKALNKMAEEFGTKPEDLWVWVGPSAGVCCYEVGSEFKEYFDSKYLKPTKNKFMFSTTPVITDQLSTLGVPKAQIEVDPHCTIDNKNYHSHRRDGQQSGRMLAVIGLKTNGKSATYISS